ncbi:DUF6266 family protein [Daejeonella sp.]|uniref:DUF6266 family protein n=1 Tax=Daejeonella sp. TaxID=2805397 RepID=UPI003983BA8A
MGKLINGINGPFIGKVGTVIGSSRRGVPYMKGPYKTRKTDISEKELRNRDKFAFAQAWLKPLLEVVRLGFKNYSVKSQGFVSAKSYLYKHALKLEGDTHSIDPSLMRISFGNLPISKNAAVGVTNPYELTFTWEPETSGSDYVKDQVLMVAYNIRDMHVSYVLQGQFRSVGKDILPLSHDYKPGTVVHVYIAFIAADRSRQSDSLYLGEVVL